MREDHNMSSRNQINESSTNANPFEQTAIFRIARLNSQITACNDLLSRVGELEEKRAALAREEGRLAEKEQEIDRQHAEQLGEVEKDLSSAKETLAKAENNVRQLRDLHTKLKERHEALNLGQLWREDLDYVALAIEEQTRNQAEQLSQAETDAAGTQNQIDSLTDTIQSDEVEFQSLESELELFSQGELPDRYLRPVEIAKKNATDNQDKKIRELREKRDSLDKHCSKLQLEISNLDGKLRKLESNDSELKQVSSKGVFNRLGSSAWWGSFATDYAKQAQDVSLKKAQYLQDLKEHQRQLLAANTDVETAMSERARIIEAAEMAERTCQYEVCQSTATSLPQKIKEKKAQLLTLETKMASSVRDIEVIKEALQHLRDQTAEKSRQELIRQIETALDKSSSNINAADIDVNHAKDGVVECTSSINKLRDSLSTEKSAVIQSMNAQLEELRQSVTSTEETLLKEAQNFGIDVSSSDIHGSINERRSELISELEEQQGGSKLNDEESYDQESYGRNRTENIDQFGSMGQESAEVMGNVYLDFLKNEDDNQDASGRTYPGLRSQMAELRRSLGRELFPDSSDSEDLLSIFMDTFFPEGVTQSYYISNLSVRADQPYLSIRPQIIGPRLERLLPRGRTIAVCGRLWDNQRDVDNPVFLVQRILEMSHSVGRPFELLVSGFVFRQSQNVYPGFKRQDNVLSNEFITKLPPISVDTRDRLQDWRAYLDWRERLVHARLVGLRYIDVNVLEDGRVRFLTVCESKEGFDQVRRTLRNDELYAYGLNYSQDPWQFEYNDRHRGRGAELGDFAGQDEDVENPGDSDIEGLPWDNPFFSHIYFRLPEDDQNEFDGILNNGGTVVEAARQYLNGVHSNGFLALSVVGDISLVRRQRTELQQLQEQSGYAPFLSSYLFDIQAANEPLELKSIPEGQWLQSSLNDDQRLAVQKMISTPDLAMVQGPPGTGKTTMIAEATWQYVHEGKKVLLVSQASLAVNNVLERMAQIPAIRAIRLSRRERKNEREHPYSQERALETYYRSIADTCKNRTLNVWSNADCRIKELSDWVASFDFVSSDLSSLRDKAEKLKKERLSLKEELAQLRETDELSRSVDKQKNDIQAFREFIKGGVTYSGSVTDQTLTAFYNLIISVFDRLPDETGIRVNTLWRQPDYGSSLERTRYAVEALLNWRKAVEFKPQILGDIERLRSTDGDSVLSPEVELRLAELQRKLDQTQKAMETDASKVSEWQSIQKEIRDVKRKGTGLDRETYSRLLNVPDSQILRALTSSDTSRAEVIVLLEKLHDILCKTESAISNGIGVISRDIETQLDAMTVVEADKSQLRRLEGEFRHITERQKEITSEISSKEKRLSEIIVKRSKNERSVDLAHINLSDFRAKAIQELNDYESQINQSKAFRESWEDLLEKWVKDLTDENTVRCDQDNFLSTYINACNVVGVTCTENRRTLEDAGHTWFDAVIVDEVSKATPTEIIMPLMMARTAILVGDHRQLPPLFKEHEGSWEEAVADQEESPDEDQNTDSELTAENFDRFKRMVTSSLFKEHFENAPDSLKSFLFTQYRMHPQIMRVVNQFYENRLKCGLVDPDGRQPDSDPKGHRVHGLTLIGEKSQQYIVPERHVAWLDSTVDPFRKPHHERRDLGTSKVNELECVLIAKTLCDIELSSREQGYGTNGKARKEVGIVTFYGRQVRAIRDAIRRIQATRNMRFNAIEYDINTVDRYQGQERPIILVSMVRNPPFRLSQRANTAQFERINVAFSRAQELLIIAGAKDVFCKYPVFLPNLDRPGTKKVEVYRYIIDEIQRNGGLWSSDYIVSPQEYEILLPPGFSSQRSSGRRNKNKNDRRGRK